LLPVCFSVQTRASPIHIFTDFQLSRRFTNVLRGVLYYGVVLKLSLFQDTGRLPWSTDGSGR
jgi:hypothetical protein